MNLCLASLLIVSCLPLSIVGEPLLFRVDVTMPQKKGRSEMNDIAYINILLDGLTGITVRYALKSFDNQHALLVLEAQKIGNWPPFTSAMSFAGYQITVNALKTCDDYAKEVNVDVTYQPWSELTDLPLVRFYDMVFDNKISDGAEYLAYVKQHLENDAYAHTLGITGDCYQSLSDMPVQLIYFSRLSTGNEVKLDDRLIHESRAELDYQWLQNIKQYKETR